MKAKDFIVVRRPSLGKITKHPSIVFASYGQRLDSMQSVVQSIQQAYLGTRERAVSCSKAGIPPVRVELFVGSAGRWTQEVSKYIRLPRHYRTNVAGTICNAFGKSYRTLGKS